VHVCDEWDGAGIRTGRERELRPRVASDDATGWVCPVQRLVNRKQVGQVVAVAVDQVVDPLYAYWPLPSGLDSQ